MSEPNPNNDASRSRGHDGDSLQSWKEIAVYLQREPRTVMRWEKEEALPVHRHQHSGRGTVYAYPAELDAWLESRRAAGVLTLADPSRPWRGLGAAAAVLLPILWFVSRGPILNPSSPLAEAAGLQPGIVKRQLSALSFDFRGSPFPDGKSFATTVWDGDTGELAVGDLESGERRILTRPAPGKFSYYASVSPDGKLIAFSTWVVNHWQLRIVSVDADEPQETERVLLRGDESEAFAYNQPFGWTPDSKKILVLLESASAEAQIGLLTVADGEVTVVKSLGWRWPEHLGMSPDGKWIAYDVPVRDDSPDKDIFLLAADGSRETALVERPGLDYGPVWTPGGGEVLFASDRGDGIGLWSVAVAEGRPTGPAHLVMPAMGRMLPVEMTPGGALFYGVVRGEERIYVAEMGPETGRALKLPAPAADRFVGYNLAPMWSGDGKRLAFFSRRNAVSVAPTPGSLTLVVSNLDTGEEVERVAPFGAVYAGRWFPDGRSLLVAGQDRRSRWFLHRVDVETGKSKVLTGPISKRFRVPRPALSPDGKTAYYVRYVRKDKVIEWTESIVVALDIATGTTRELHRLKQPLSHSGIAVSPDGEQLAFLAKHSNYPESAETELILSKISSDGGQARELFRITDQSNTYWADHGIDWSRDGRYVIFPRATAAHDGYPGKGWDLFRVPAAGGPAESLGLADSGISPIRFPSVHPDGRRIAFQTGGWGELGRELWVLENFLPTSTASDD